MNPSQSSELRELFSQLKACPSWNNRFPGEMPRLAWERFRMKGGEDELTPAVVAGLVLHDETFAQLLNEAERSQMLLLAQKALEQFRHETNPPCKLGDLIAATLEETI